jgi:hypothetical protein
MSGRNLPMDGSRMCSGDHNYFVLVGREGQLFFRVSPLCVMQLMSIFIS